MQTNILQISAGRGPEECSRVVFLVLEKIIKDLNQLNIKYEILNTEEGRYKDTLLSANILIHSDIHLLKQNWEGAIQWIGQSPYRPHHKRKNWFINIQCLAFNNLPNFEEKDVQYETCRASGPGGQNINKVETAVRAKHLPTGIQVMSMEARSQLENKQKSLEKLRMHFLIMQKANRSAQQQVQWQQHLDIQRGNPTKTFSGNL